jgi:hypothetical protein
VLKRAGLCCNTVYCGATGGTSSRNSRAAASPSPRARRVATHSATESMSSSLARTDDPSTSQASPAARGGFTAATNPSISASSSAYSASSATPSATEPPPVGPSPKNRCGSSCGSSPSSRIKSSASGCLGPKNCPPRSMHTRTRIKGNLTHGRARPQAHKYHTNTHEYTQYTHTHLPHALTHL